MLDELNCTPNPSPAPTINTGPTKNTPAPVTDTSTLQPSSQPSPSSSSNKLVASDGEPGDRFGSVCSMYEDRIVIGAPKSGSNDSGAVYLFNIDGSELRKIVGNGEHRDEFGTSVSMSEKVVVGTYNRYVHIFSQDGNFERAVDSEDNSYFKDEDVATHEGIIAISGSQNFSDKVFIYSTSGDLLKVITGGRAISITDETIVTTGFSGTLVYSNSGNFPQVVGDHTANSYNGAAYLYKTDGTLIKALDRGDNTSTSYFGSSVAITGEKIVIGSSHDNDSNGSISIYSAITGDFEEKIVAPDPDDLWFGSSICTSGSHYVVGAVLSGAAYIFQFS